MSTLSNVEFIRRRRQGRNNFDIENSQDLSDDAYFDAYMSNRMLSSPSDANLNYILNNIKNYSYQEPAYAENETVEQIEANNQKALSNVRRTLNTAEEVQYNVTRGIFGFVEGVGDFIITSLGAIGSWFGADDKWAKDAVSYDWSSRASRTMQNLQNIGTDALTYMFTGGQDNAFANEGYWSGSGKWDFSDKAMQQYEEDLYNSSFGSALPDWFHEGYLNVAQAIGQMLPSIAIGVATGGAGFGLGAQKLASVGSMALSAAGGSSQSALNESPDADINQVLLYGVVSGAVEGATEYALSGLGKVAGAIGNKVGLNTAKLSNLLPNSVSGFFGKQVSKNFAVQMTKEFVEEGLEEVMSDAVSPLLQSIYNGKSVEQNYNEWDKSSLLESFLLGGITTLVMGAPGQIVDRVRYGKNPMAAKTTLSQVAEDYNSLVELQEKGKAVEISSDGTIIYNQQAQNIINEMTNKIESFRSQVDKMNNNEKNKLYKSIFGETVEKGFERTEKTLAEAQKRYETLVEQGANDRAIENVKKWVDSLQTVINEGKEKWISSRINENVDLFAPKSALTAKTNIDNKMFRRHMRNYFKHSNERNSRLIENDLADIKADLSAFDKQATPEEKIAFGKQIANYNDYFSNESDDGKALEVFNEFVASFKDSTVKEQIMRYQIHHISNELSSNTKLMFRNGIRSGSASEYDRAKNTIYINRAYANDNAYAKAIAHEYIGHVLYDNYLRKDRNARVEEIKQTEWYKQNKDKFEKTYNLVGKENYEEYKSELFANYLEQVVFNDAVNFDQVLETLDVKKFFSPINRLIYKLNGSTANNSLIDELHFALRRARNRSYDLRVFQLENLQTAYSKAVKMDENTVEGFIANNYKNLDKIDELRFIKKGRKYFEVEDDNYMNEIERYRTENSMSTDKFPISGIVFSNYVRDVINADLDDFSWDYEYSAEIREIFDKEIKKSTKILKKDEPLSLEDFKSALSLYKYATKLYFDSDSFALEKKHARAEKKEGNIDELEEFEFEDKVGLLYDTIEKFDKAFEEKIKNQYGFDIQNNRYLEERKDTEIVNTRVDQAKAILQDNATQVPLEDKKDVQAETKIVVEKMENAAKVQENIEKAIEINNQMDEKIQALDEVVEGQDLYDKAINAYEKLSDDIRNLKIQGENLLELNDRIDKEILNNEITEAELEILARDTLPAVEQYTTEIFSRLIGKTNKASESLYNFFNDNGTFINRNISRQQASKIVRSVNKVLFALQNYIFNPVRHLSSSIKLIDNEFVGEGIQDYDEYIESSGDSRIEDLVNLEDKIRGDIQGTLANWESLTAIVGKSSKLKGNNIFQNLGKDKARLKNFYKFDTLYDTADRVANDMTITGSNKSGIKKDMEIHFVSEETYNKLINNLNPAIALKSNVNKSKKHPAHYVLIKDTYDGHENLSGFSYYYMASSNANRKQSLVIDSTFNLGNNTLHLQNIGTFIDSEIFKKGNTKKTNAVAMLFDFKNDAVSARQARDVLADYYIYPFARLENVLVYNRATTKKENGEEIKVTTPVARTKSKGIEYNTIFIYEPLNITTIYSLEKLKKWKISDKINKEKFVGTIYSAINTALETSRKQTNDHYAQLEKEKRRLNNINYYDEHSDSVNASASYRSGKKQGKKEVREEYNQKLKEAKINLKEEFDKKLQEKTEEIKTIYEERENRRKELERVAKNNQKIVSEMDKLFKGVGLEKPFFKQIERDAFNYYMSQYDNVHLIGSEKIENIEESAKKYARAQVRDVRNKYREKLLVYGRTLNNYKNMNDIISTGKEIYSDDFISSVYPSIVKDIDSQLENGTYFAPQSADTINFTVDNKRVNALNSRTPVKGADDTSFSDSFSKVATEKLESRNLMQEEIKPEDSLKEKAEKLKNNFQYSDRLTEMQIYLTNQQAGYEKAIISTGAFDGNKNQSAKERAENFSNELRRAGNKGQFMVTNGMPIYDQNYNLERNDDGTIRHTRSLVEANRLIIDIFDKLGEKKPRGFFHRNSNKLSDGQSKIVRDIYNHMILTHAIDNNLNFADTLRARIIEFIDDNELDLDNFKVSLGYISDCLKAGSNIDYNVLLTRLEQDLIALEYKELGTVDSAKAKKIVHKNFQRLFDKVADVFDNVEFKDIYGRTIPANIILSNQNPFLLELDKVLYAKDGSNVSLLEAIKSRIADKSDFFEEEWEEILSNYTSKVLEQSELEALDRKQLSEEQKQELSSVLNERAIINRLIKNFRNSFERPSTARMEKTRSEIEDFYKSRNIKEFEQVIDIYRENLDQMLNYRVANGLVSPELAGNFKKYYPHYVPLNRVKITSRSKGSRIDIVNNIRVRKGSNEVIQPINDMIYETMTTLPYKATLQNQMSYIYNHQKKETPLITFILQGEPEKRITNIFEQTLDDFSNAEQSGQVVKFFQFDNEGNKQIIEAHLTDLAMQGLRNTELKARNIPLLTSGVTLFKQLTTSLNPFFIIRNFSRDISDAFLSTKNGTLNFLKNLPKAMKEIAFANKQPSEMWDLFVREGGLSTSYFGELNSKGLIELLSSKATENKLNPLRYLEKANAMVEVLSRFNEFELSYDRYKKMGFSEANALNSALTDSANITTDFSRGGIGAKWLNRNIIPFLNAQIQGASKVYRLVVGHKTKKEWIRLLVAALILGFGLNALNDLIYWWDEDYQALPDYTKDSYYLIKVGNGDFLKIPKGRIVGTIGSMFSNFADMIIEGKSPDKAFSSFLDTASTNLAPVDTSFDLNFIWKPFSDASKNITWYGQSIDKQSDLTKRPSERYDATTSEIAKAIGQIFQYSPKRIDYILNQSTGVVGDILLPMTTSQYQGGQALLNFVKSNTSVSVVNNNRYAGEFYDYRQQVQYDASDGDLIAGKVYGYLSRCIDQIDVLEEQLNNATNNAERYAISLTIREAYQQAIANAEEFKKVLARMDEESLAREDRMAMTEAYAEVFGAEMALKYYSTQTYEKATYSTEFGVSYEDYYNLYFSIRGASSKEEARKYVRQAVGLNSGLIALTLKLCGVALSESEKASAVSYLKRQGRNDLIKALNLGD